MTKASRWSLNASILLYVLWLLLPAVQTTGRSYTGVLAVALFGLGVLLDRDSWLDVLPRAVCAAAVPLGLMMFLSRGGANKAGYYVQQAMFWFPLVFAGYARKKGDPRLWKHLKWVLLAAVTVTTLTTIGWLFEGMFLRGDKVYAYSRSLGYGGEGREAYLKELMLKNIGGYDFVYASVIMLPLSCLGVQKHRGWPRAGYLALLMAQTVMIVMSQYTYAMLFAAAILAVEGIALLLRRFFRLQTGASLLWGAVPLVLGALLLQPLASLAASLCREWGLNNFARSFELLLQAFSGGALADDSRLGYYLTAWNGFLRSPIVGSLLSGDRALSLHSEILDLLSGTGVLGTAAFGAVVWVMGRGVFRGFSRQPQLVMMAAALCAVALLGTVFYSRDVMAAAALGALLVLEGDHA